MGNVHNNILSGHKRRRRHEELWALPAPIDSASLTQSLSQTSAESDQHLPIHERKLQVNLQTASPLYNGRIPPEIRDRIFFYCLLEYSRTDEESQYLPNTKYTRPGYTSKRKIDIALLQACRRVYLETYHLPALSREHVFWHSPPTTPPHQSQSSNIFLFDAEIQHFKQFQQWQLKLVREIHLFTQMYWLEQTFPIFCHQYFMQGIQKVKITIRRSDWWWNERNAPLAISPHRNDYGQNVVKMLQDIATEQRGGVVSWSPGAWGSAFKHLKSLKELEIEFETSEDKKAELEAILKWAKTWRFPLNDGMVLSTEGLDVTSSSWQTPMCYWSDHCPHCGKLGRCRLVNPVDKNCAERMKMKELGRGPTCYIHNMRWKVARDVKALDRWASAS